MAGAIDILQQEKQVGKEFSTRIRTNLLSSIKRQTKSKSGLALRTSVKPKFVRGYLDRITIFTPYYIFPILHTGFEGTKSNGVNARLKAREFITEAFQGGKLAEDLSTVIGENRAANILGRIDIKLFSNQAK